jgi:hypothetical protein
MELGSQAEARGLGLESCTHLNSTPVSRQKQEAAPLELLRAAGQASLPRRPLDLRQTTKNCVSVFPILDLHMHILPYTLKRV